MVPLKSGLQKSRVVEFYSICFRNLQQVCFPWVSSSFLQIRSKDPFKCCKFSRLILKFQPNQMCVCSECISIHFYLCHRKLKRFAWITSWIEFVPLNLALWLTTVFLAPYFYSWNSKRICLVLFHLQISFVCLNVVLSSPNEVQRANIGSLQVKKLKPETYWLAPKLNSKQWTPSIPQFTHWPHSYNCIVICYSHFPSGNERVQN